jgi:two-component system chemotaxis response regulator CheB
MEKFKKSKVLIVDDSVLFREVLSRAISADPTLKVIASATDPFDAKDKILQFEPDVMTCDVEMPRMNGIEFIQRLLPQYPLPVVVVSSISDMVFDALNAGAVDFVVKPDITNSASIERFINELIAKIKVAASAKVSMQPSQGSMGFGFNDKLDFTKIVAIGASTGGTEAIYQVLKQLPDQMPGILIVQHIPPVFSRIFAERLSKQTQLQVKEAENGDWVQPGKVLIAPGDQHLSIKKVGDSYKVNVAGGDKVNGHCPSVDVLFESVAKQTKGNAVGIILTGMGSDGAKGLLTMRCLGARTIGQDEQSSVVYGMPKVAYEIGAVEKQAHLSRIPQLLFQALRIKD